MQVPFESYFVKYQLMESLTFVKSLPTLLLSLYDLIFTESGFTSENSIATEIRNKKRKENIFISSEAFFDIDLPPDFDYKAYLEKGNNGYNSSRTRTRGSIFNGVPLGAPGAPATRLDDRVVPFGYGAPVAHGAPPPGYGAPLSGYGGPGTGFGGPPYGDPPYGGPPSGYGSHSASHQAAQAATQAAAQAATQAAAQAEYYKQLNIQLQQTLAQAGSRPSQQQQQEIAQLQQQIQQILKNGQQPSQQLLQQFSQLEKRAEEAEIGKRKAEQNALEYRKKLSAKELAQRQAEQQAIELQTQLSRQNELRRIQQTTSFQKSSIGFYNSPKAGNNNNNNKLKDQTNISQLAEYSALPALKNKKDFEIFNEFMDNIFKSTFGTIQSRAITIKSNKPQITYISYLITDDSYKTHPTKIKITFALDSSNNRAIFQYNSIDTIHSFKYEAQVGKDQKFITEY